MSEESPIILLDNNIRPKNLDDKKVFDLTLDVYDQKLDFQIAASVKCVKLSAIVPTARTIASQIACAVLKDFRNYHDVPCCQRCAPLCHELVKLSVPEVFRLTEEITKMPDYQKNIVLKSHIEGPEKTLNQTKEIPADLHLPCPFLVDDTCAIYSQRPITCRQKIVIAPFSENIPERPETIAPPIDINAALVRLDSMLEQTAPKTVNLQWALLWSNENAERSAQVWPANLIVEKFIDILNQMPNEDLALTIATPKHALQKV